MKYFFSLFAKQRHEQVIRNGVMYRLTFKGDRLVREKRMDAFGGFTRLNDEAESKTLGDRKRTDLVHSSALVDKVNYTKKPDVV